MMKWISLILCLFWVSLSFGKDNFCSNQPSKHDLVLESNHLSFTNSGGLFNGGVCWWHSRFTRNALYLVSWHPERPKPTLKEAEKLIKKIHRGLGKVDIPGFANLHSFSEAYAPLIKYELEKWQITDGLLKNKWIDGLTGTPWMPASWLSKYMDFLYETSVKTADPLFVRVQLQGITAHAWLIRSIDKTANGYKFEVLDSNFFGIRTFEYTRGSNSMMYYGKRFIPYIQFTPELVKLKKLRQQICAK